jgi:hypothetical protein
MADLYSALIGEAPTDKEQSAELAAALRRRRSYGELGMLTGDRVLAPLGDRMAKSADSYADSLQDTRQKDIDNRQTKAYQEGQLSHMGAALAEETRYHDMADKTTQRGQDLAYQSALARAMAQQAKANKPNKLTYPDRKRLEELSGLLQGAHQSIDTFKDDYAQTMSGKLIPEVGQSRLANTMASMGAGTKNQKEAADWWTAWNLIYTLPRRNQTFGATLTPTEKQSWFNSDINPSMSGEQIRKRLGVISALLKRGGAIADKTYRAGGFDPDVIDSYQLSTPEDVAAVSGGGPSGRGHTPVEASDDGLTPEEEAELLALKKSLGHTR